MLDNYDADAEHDAQVAELALVLAGLGEQDVKRVVLFARGLLFGAPRLVGEADGVLESGAARVIHLQDHRTKIA